MTNNLQQKAVNKNLINNLVISFSLLIVCFGLFVPFSTHAVDTVYQPLEQIEGLTSPSGNSGAGIDIEKYLPNIIKFAIGLASALAVIYLIIGGFQYISSDAMFEKSEGKERIKNALLGLFLAISSVVILNTISPKLVNIKLDIKVLTPQNLSPEGTYKQPAATPSGNCVCADRNTFFVYGPISQYIVDDGTACEQACSCDKAGFYSYSNAINLGYRVVGLSCPLSGASLGDAWPDDEDERETLTDLSDKITFNNPNCEKIGQSGCTSLSGAPDSMLSAIGQLARDCNCVVRISGGTEYWLHGKKSSELKTADTNHQPGGYVIDLSKTPSLEAFLKAKGKDASRSHPTPYCTPGTERYWYEDSKSGLKGLYVNENTAVVSAATAAHWHVCYFSK